jgi:Fe-S cluster biogenesis protein NfuA/nitrite reductase/ring-hydroxylating ferredoxin subunit
VRGALEKCRPYLASHGGNVELVSLEEPGVVRLRMQGSCHGCPSSAVTLKLAIEQAIHEAAPDVTAILVEGQTAPSVVTIESAARTNGHAPADAEWLDVAEPATLGPGTTWRQSLDGHEVLFCRLEERLYAYRARCPACEADLEAAPLAGHALRCPGCGQAYDIVHAGRAHDRPDLHLDPYPLLTRNGRTQVALPASRVAAVPA